jgi:pimeloyl-ACP methyl ester carboxylesterase
MQLIYVHSCMFRTLAVVLLAFPGLAQPPASGKLVDLGGHKLHVNCTGTGSPTVVVENGFDEFSSDWVLVQSQVEKFTRVCTYDRAGYAWSDPGPKPRTYAQINLELHDALKKLGERGPYVLVGHSFGGPVVRNYALMYPNEMAGLVFVETVSDDQRVVIGGGKTLRIADDAKGRIIPATHERMGEVDRPKIQAGHDFTGLKIEAPYDRLPEAQQKMWLWAIVQPQREDAANSEREWSCEYLARWLKDPKSGSLGSLPLIVLTREKGGYGNDLDHPAAELERERLAGQAKLAKLSSRGSQRIIAAGHDMHLEAPDEVVKAIRDVMAEVSNEKRIPHPKKGS